jgi:hypothetical protein
MLTSGRPATDEYSEFLAGYVSLVPETNVMAVLEEQDEVLRSFMSSFDESRSRHRYAEGKWSVREVIGHCLDAERVFSTRALCFARGETSPMPSYDENAYAASAPYDEVPLSELLDEFSLLRGANVLMLRHLKADAWTRRGVASGREVSVRALAYAMAGHVRHHINVLRERY